MGQPTFSILEIGLLDSFWKQWNPSEDIIAANFSNISKKIAIAFKRSEFFLLFSELIDLQEPLKRYCKWVKRQILEKNLFLTF